MNTPTRERFTKPSTRDQPFEDADRSIKEQNDENGQSFPFRVPNADDKMPP